MAKAAGYELTEMFNKEKLAKSCGSAVALAYMESITKMVAAGRWDDLKRTESKIMLTASPQAYLCLSTAIPEDMELVASWKPNTNTPYSVRVFLQEGYECIEKTADYAELFGKLEATTGETVNVLEKAALIASTLQGYYLDIASASTLLESKISAKGDTEFRIYFTK